MKKSVLAIFFVFGSCLPLFAQVDSVVLQESRTLDLQFLISEALLNNPEIQAAAYQMDVMKAKVPQASALADPEITFMREDMPGFRYSQAMYSKFELSQIVRFPSKLSTQGKLASIEDEHAHHEHLEVINEVVEKLKSAYFQLWCIQQNIILSQENARLMKQFINIALIKYGNGQATQSDVLKAQIELSKISNELIELRQQEIGTKSLLMAILNRSTNDTLGVAVIPEDVVFTANLDTIRQLALQMRPMLIHDSLSIKESNIMYTLAKQEYLPDLKFGLTYETLPASGIDAWSISAGITVPFAPWTLGKASARKEEAEAAINKSTSDYYASRNRVLAEINDLFARATGKKQQLESYRAVILPQARQSLKANLTAYETGTINFLTLIDSYRTIVDLTREYFMLRLEFEQAVAGLEKTVGVQNIASL